MFPSDYGHAVLPQMCVRTMGLKFYNLGNCWSQNWLYQGGEEWNLTQHSGSASYVYYLINEYIVSDDTKRDRIVRPILYLKSSITSIGGDGTQESPYEIR